MSRRPSRGSDRPHARQGPDAIASPSRDDFTRVACRHIKCRVEDPSPSVTAFASRITDEGQKRHGRRAELVSCRSRCAPTGGVRRLGQRVRKRLHVLNLSRAKELTRATSMAGKSVQASLRSSPELSASRSCRYGPRSAVAVLSDLHGRRRGERGLQGMAEGRALMSCHEATI